MTARSEIPIGAPADPPVPSSIAVEAQRDAVKIAPRGELDLATVGQLQRELTRVIDAGPARIVIDLRGVEFLDSTGLHTLLTAHAQAQRDNWELTIIPGPRAVQQIFEITGTIDRLPFATTNGRGATPQRRVAVHSGERQLDVERGTTAPSAPAVSLATVLPDILAGVLAEDRDLVERMLRVPLVSARDEDLAAVIGTQIPDAFDFVIVDGVVIKQTVLRRRAALELLGAGDVLAPPLTAARQIESRSLSRYLARGPVSLAALETHFRLAVRRWPEITDFLHDRLGQQTHRASMHLAMLHLPRVEDRITALFADLAERFGRMSGDSILIDLPLTHELIGGLVASRRPTVSLALQKLSTQGTLQRHDKDRWTLAPRILTMSSTAPQPHRGPADPGPQ